MSQRTALPRDSRLVALLLATAGAEDAEPGVVAMLLEFAHRASVTTFSDTTGWTTDVLQDALVYREHAAQSGATGPPKIEDIKLAIQSRVEQQTKTTFPKEFLMSLASQLNAHQLPPIEGVFGPLKLPPERERLTAVNWDMVPRPPPTAQSQAPYDFEMDEVKPQTNGHVDGFDPASLGRL